MCTKHDHRQFKYLDDLKIDFVFPTKMTDTVFDYCNLAATPLTCQHLLDSYTVGFRRLFTKYSTPPS